MVSKTDDKSEQIVIMCLEPSKRFSEICGFPYYIEKRFTVKELLKQKVIDKNDIIEMEGGKQICKTLPYHQS